MLPEYPRPACRVRNDGERTMTKLKIMIVVMSVLLSWPALALTDKQLGVIESAAGSLHIMEGGSGKYITLKNNVIHRGSADMTVYRHFRPKKAYDALLLRDFTGPIHCPVEFRFLVLYRGGDVQVTPPFGHCSVRPQMTTDQTTIIVEFDPFGSMPGATWIFDGKDLKRREP